MDRSTYKGGKLIGADPKLDWAGNLAHMMGVCILMAQLCGLHCQSRWSQQSKTLPGRIILNHTDIGGPGTV